MSVTVPEIATVIPMPAIGTYTDVAGYLKLARRTLYKMTCERRFRQGIYLGGGRFNLSRLRECIEKHGSYLRQGHSWT